MNNPNDYEARADLMWASAINTFGMLRCGKESAWSLYGCETIAITESIYKQYGIATTFNEIAEVPEKEVILEALKEFEDDDVLTKDEVKDMILRCIL